VPIERRTDSLGRERVIAGAGHGQRYARDDALLARDAEMLAQAAAGATTAEIAVSFGVSRRIVQRRLREARERWPPGQESADAWREKLNASLDDIEAKARGKFARPGPAWGSSGRVVVDPASGEPVPNSQVQMRAIDTLLRIQQRRARLNGADRPVLSELSVHVSTAQDDEIAALVSDMIAAGLGGEAAAIMLEAVTGKVVAGAIESGTGSPESARKDDPGDG
jgi:DNA-binding CsgD family transcriptional regulator